MTVTSGATPWIMMEPGDVELLRTARGTAAAEGQARLSAAVWGRAVDVDSFDVAAGRRTLSLLLDIGFPKNQTFGSSDAGLWTLITSYMVTCTYVKLMRTACRHTEKGQELQQWV